MLEAQLARLVGQFQEFTNGITNRLQQVEAVNAQLNAQLAQVSAQAQAVPRDDGEHEGKQRGGVLDDRDFRSCPKFSGDLSGWDSWRHSFCLCCYKVPGLSDVLEDVVRQAAVKTNISELVIDPEIKAKYQNALYRHLAMTTEGEANTVVMSVMHKGDHGALCGFGALALLSQRYNPKTPGRVLQQWALVLEPGRVKDVRVLQAQVEQWEHKRAKSEREFGEKMTDTLSIAILVKMLPRDLQDQAYQMGKVGQQLVYREVRDRIMGIASNRAFDMSTPTPMDVGCVDDKSDVMDELEVDAINGECHNCRGWGHAARECPSKPGLNKGKGKGGNNSSGSSVQKPSGGKASGKALGKPKGFQGQCFRCQAFGHSAKDCRAPAPKPVQEVAADTDCQQGGATQVACVGSCWTIGAVESGWKVVQGRRKKARETSTWTPSLPSKPPGLHKPPERMPETVFIGTVKKPEGAMTTEVTVDSAAEESVCPVGWGKQFGLQPVPEDQQTTFVNASGGRITHYGSRKVVVAAASGEHLGMNFQVTDVKKPLLAVSRLIEHGN